MKYQSIPNIALLLLALAGYTAAQSAYQQTTPASGTRLEVELPLPIQVALYFGDRYLASNSDFFIAEMQATSQLSKQEMATFTHYLKSANALNPYHEDTYYVAAATIPWKPGGELQACQDILLSASESRQWDWLPLFLRGFNAFYFFKDYETGAQSMLAAAKRSNPKNRQALSILAGRLYAKSTPNDMAVHALKLMAESSQYEPLKQHLLARAEQLRLVMNLQKASDQLVHDHPNAPLSLNTLVQYGYIKNIPLDPLGQGFRLSPSGHVEVIEPSK